MSANAIPAEAFPDRTALERYQRQRLGALLGEIRVRNPFYARKLGSVSFDPLADPLEALPFTTRDELQADQFERPPYGTNLTYSLDRYVRVHQTSGTQGRPLRWLDTDESWAWWRRCWMHVLCGARVTALDRVLFPFSFGPFIGFWAAFDAAVELGCLVLPAGGMSTLSRLRHLLDLSATVVVCTPTYALHMAEAAAEHGIPLASSAVRAVIVAGEPGGSVPAVRRRIEDAWGAEVFDHAGMTEAGAWGFESAEARGALRVLETEFIAEVIDPKSGATVPDGTAGELVLTNLGRLGSPVIRYRTGDLVRLTRGEPVAGRWLARAEGGVCGRVDDALVIRGVNVFPSAIEGILRELDEVAEFQIQVRQVHALAELELRIEPRAGVDTSGLAERIARHVRDRLNVRPKVTLAVPGSLPRFELKSQRVVLGESRTAER
ncbi:MAG: AMP-binding protein [Phycisphaerae bacterium]|jgi:phenylacetate-CoA ligase